MLENYDILMTGSRAVVPSWFPKQECRSWVNRKMGLCAGGCDGWDWNVAIWWGLTLPVESVPTSCLPLNLCPCIPIIPPAFPYSLLTAQREGIVPPRSWREEAGSKTWILWQHCSDPTTFLTVWDDVAEESRRLLLNVGCGFWIQRARASEPWYHLLVSQCPWRPHCGDALCGNKSRKGLLGVRRVQWSLIGLDFRHLAHALIPSVVTSGCGSVESAGAAGDSLTKDSQLYKEFLNSPL